MTLRQIAASYSAAGINVNLLSVQGLSYNARALSSATESESGSILADVLAAGFGDERSALLDDGTAERLGGVDNARLALLADAAQ